MKLNLDILADHLPERCRPRRYGAQDRQLRYGPPVPYEAGRPMEAGVLYIASTSALGPKPPAGTAVICVGGRTPVKWIDAGVQLLHLEGAADLYTACHDILHVYDKFQQWDDRLRAELDSTEDFSIHRILLLGTEMMKKAISVSDQVLRCVMNTEVSFTADGQFHYRLTEPYEVINAQNMENIKDASRVERQIRTPYLSMITSNDSEYYCFNLYPMGQYMGCVNISAGDRPFRESDFALADHFFSFLNKAYLHHIHAFSQSTASETVALKKLLEQIPLSEKERETLTLEEGEVFFCLKLKERRNARCLLKEYMCASVCASVPCTLYATIHHNEIVCLLRFRKDQGSWEYWKQETEAFQDYLDRMGYLCGLSDEFLDYQRLEHYLRQASYAVEQASWDPEGATLNLFSDYRLQYILYECTGSIPADTLYSSSLQRLAARDQVKGSDYLHTLDIYLQTECNASKTAELLYIHRSSLMKRLDKIQRQLGADLEDPDVRLYLRICLRARKLTL